MLTAKSDPAIDTCIPGMRMRKHVNGVRAGIKIITCRAHELNLAHIDLSMGTRVTDGDR